MASRIGACFGVPLVAEDNPLVGPPPPEVALVNAPLERVFVQVRFPTVASIQRSDFVGPFQEALRAEYPVLREHRPPNLGGVGAAMASPHGQTLWSFADPAGTWRLTLAQTFVALDTGHYTSRADFVARFARVLGALAEHVNPGVVDRVGVRYIDRVVAPQLATIRDLVRAPVAGVLATTLGGATVHALSEQLLRPTEEGGSLMARTGLVPARSTYDPSAVAALDQASWVLDVDSFVEATGPLVVGDVIALTEALCRRAYAFFRWAVTDRFLEAYRGTE